MNWKYLYAIIPTAQTLEFDMMGVDDDGGAVYTIPSTDAGLAAVVSNSSITDYRNKIQQEVVLDLATHQRVIETIMHTYPILPVRFGTVLPDEKVVHHLLRQGSALFNNTLQQIAGKVQFEVMVLWDIQQVFAEIGNNEAVMNLKQQLAGMGAEEAETAKISLGKLVKRLMDQRREDIGNILVPALQEVALDSVINPVMDDSMVVNVGLLLDRSETASLNECLNNLDVQFEEKLVFRNVGPLPPHSFATVEIQVPHVAEIEAARHLLDVAETTTMGQLRQAYHQKAKQQHPDNQPNQPTADEQMAALAKAYQLLVSYANSQAQAMQPIEPDKAKDSICDLSREAIERTLIITLKRTEA